MRVSIRVHMGDGGVVVDRSEYPDATYPFESVEITVGDAEITLYVKTGRSKALLDAFYAAMADDVSSMVEDR